MIKTHECVATIREWKDKTTGTSHKSTLVIGAIFRSSKGNQVLKLDAWPLSRDFSGWVALKPCGPAAGQPEPATEP